MRREAKDPASPIYHALARLLESVKYLKQHLDVAEPLQREGDVAFHLLRALVEADTLLQFVDPDTDPGEFFGLPESATSSADRPTLEFSHVDRPGWDFRAWFGGKATGVKRSAKMLCAEWIEAIESGPADAGEDRESLILTLGTLENYTRAIFDMISNDKLQIVETAK